MDYIHPPSLKKLLISRKLPPPSAFQLVTRKVTFRDLMARGFLHEYDHLDGISFTDRCSGKYLYHQPSFIKPKAKPKVHIEYPVDPHEIYL